MAKPTKPKDLKAGAEGEGAEAPKGGGGGGLDLKFIVTLVAIVICSLGGSAATMYFLAPMVLVPAITAQMPKAGEAAAHGEGEAAAEGEHHSPVGMNLELDEFTVNLKTDPAVGGSQFIRTKMALSIEVPKEQECGAEHKANASPPGSGKTLAEASSKADFLVGKGTLAGAAAPIQSMPKKLQKEILIANEGGGEVSCEAVFKTNMGQFVPTIRDIVNSALMKRTAAELATAEGQEALKDEIKEQINHLIGPDYKVLRVNFQDFIIQH